MTKRSLRSLCLLVSATTLSIAAAACGSSSSGGAGGSGDGGGSSQGDAQTPPEGETAVKAWLAKGDYKSWHCESATHAARSPSPHGFNRICSNDLLSQNASGDDYPEGSAGVKELWDAVGGKIIGYAVYRKLAGDSAGGANWYYYEDNPTLDPPGGVVADGKGSSGTAKSICVSCHSAAGSDSAHFGHDYVYTQVP